MSNLYLGPITVASSSANFGGIDVTNVNSISVSSAPVLDTNLANKEYVDTQITSLATTRLDALVAGSSINLDTLSEIVAYFNGLDSAASGNVSTSVSNLSNALTAEETRALAAEGVLQSNINAEEARALAAEALVQTNVDAEYERALAAEVVLQGSIDTEALRAQGAENAIQASIDAEGSRALGAESALETLISDESGRALAAESVLQSSIDSQIASLTTSSDEAVSAEEARAIAEELRIEGKVDAEIARAEAAESDLGGSIGEVQTALDEEIERAQLAESEIQSGLAAEIGRAEAQEYDIRQVAVETKRDTLVFWTPNPYIASNTNMNVTNANKPRAPVLTDNSRHDGWNFTSVLATNNVVVRVQYENTVFGTDIESTNIVVRDTNNVLVAKASLSVINATTGANEYPIPINYLITIYPGGTLSLVNASVVLVSGIAHQSNLENAVYIGNSVQSIGAEVVLSADVISNALQWNFVPKLRTIRQSVFDIAVQLQMRIAGEFPKIKVQYANSSRTYQVPAGTALATGGFILYIGNALWGDSVADHTNIALEFGTGDGTENYVETLVSVQIITSGGPVTGFDINEIRVTSLLGSERMPLESALLQLEDKYDYSNVTRNRLDALYQYFKNTDSSIHPSTGATQ